MSLFTCENLHKGLQLFLSSGMSHRRIFDSYSKLLSNHLYTCPAYNQRTALFQGLDFPWKLRSSSELPREYNHSAVSYSHFVTFLLHKKESFYMENWVDKNTSWCLIWSSFGVPGEEVSNADSSTRANTLTKQGLSDGEGDKGISFPVSPFVT